MQVINALEMIRHILEGQHLFHKSVENRGNIGDYISPCEGLPYINLENELEFAKPYREKFIKTIAMFEASQLLTIEIVRSEKGQCRLLATNSLSQSRSHWTNALLFQDAWS